MGCVTKFLFAKTPPNVNHRLNALETIGNGFLEPLAHAGGTISIKTKEGESLLCRKVFAVALAIITLPLSIIGILLKGVGQAWPHATIQATDVTSTKIHLTPQQRVDECYKQVEMFKQVSIEQHFVDGNGLPKFVMIGGTALGSERHGGMIPWDDDVDVAVFDEENFLQLKAPLLAAGLEIHDAVRFNSMYKLKFTREKFKELYPEADYNHSTELDVFIYSKMSDGSYTFDTTYARSNWPNDYATREEMEAGFELRPFGNLQLPAFKRQATLLQRAYGENCLTHGLETHGHARICGFVIPFAKFGAHFFEIIRYKPCVRPDNGLTTF